MANFIELHGADTQQPWTCNVEDINAYFPVEAIPPAQRKAVHGKTKCIVNTFSGNHFQATETYDEVKRMLEVAQEE